VTDLHSPTGGSVGNCHHALDVPHFQEEDFLDHRGS
jgi:hypothetical protein